jgi:hypothetical protein
MKIALVLIGIIATILLYVSFRGNKHQTTNLTNARRERTMVQVRENYIYNITDHNDVNVKNIDLLTDIEFYILECTKNTTYAFYVIGGWVRDRVSGV